MHIDLNINLFTVDVSRPATSPSQAGGKVGQMPWHPFLFYTSQSMINYCGTDYGSITETYTASAKVKNIKCLSLLWSILLLVVLGDELHNPQLTKVN
jgi:hypothetical protein